MRFHFPQNITNSYSKSRLCSLTRERGKKYQLDERENNKKPCIRIKCIKKIPSKKKPRIVFVRLEIIF